MPRIAKYLEDAQTGLNTPRTYYVQWLKEIETRITRTIYTLLYG